MSQPPPPPPPNQPPGGASPDEPEGPPSLSKETPDQKTPGQQAPDGPGQQSPEQQSPDQQAPQAPAQPPQQGGFGAPPQPPGGGYGYPQQPPSGGGYGYPQQQGGFGAPPQGPGYGFPQQPPHAGYGYPQQPGQPPGQPPYGPGGPGMYPTAPPGGYGPGGPGAPGGGANGKVIAIIAAAVAAVVVIATVGFFLVNDDSDTESRKKNGPSPTGGEKPASAEGKELFKIKSPTISSDRPASVPGAWATDEIFAKSTVHGIIGMDASSGEEAWNVELDGEVCATSRHVADDGRTALIFKESKAERADCTQIAVIDLDDGKKTWQKSLPDGDIVSASGVNLTISQNVVAAKWIGGSVGYKVTSGTRLWQSLEQGNCEDEGFAGGKVLMAVVRCGSYSDPVLKVQKVDPETGKSTWEFDVPKGVERTRIISTDPVVLAISAGTSTTTDVMTVGEDKKLKAKISLGDRKYDPGCYTEVESCASVAVDEKFVYMPTGTHEGQTSSTNEIIAFDFETGKPEWKSDAGEQRTMIPVRVLDGKLIAYKKPTYSGNGGQVVAIDPEGRGKQEIYLENPGGSSRTENNFAAISMREPPLYQNGRLFLHHTLISRNSVNSYAQYLGIGFGAE
ncbi:PQQ-binding-like beta-propeller repeat protein [Streptomyces ovatisporus]|uniref:PQQ-binding-like beta-propeller repeat protein n=1 Tax=Streptomyces ovatisporus TaxID=1128682 RepID=A0ABV9A9K6_9ACTN